MTGKISLPPELQHLLEKRLEADRRKKTRRSEPEQPVQTDKREGTDRRNGKRRRDS